MENNSNKKMLTIVAALSAAVVLLLGIILGFVATSKGWFSGNETETEEQVTDTLSQALVEEVIPEDTVALEVEEEPVMEVTEVKTATPKKVEEKKVEAKKEEPVKVEEKKEKTYGYYPSFYVKRQYFTVSHEEGMHTLYVYTDGNTKCVRARTNQNWLEEEKMGRRGGSEFHVKKNRHDEPRKGELYLYDDKGRQITIYVTQQANPD